ncbi:MAG: hypothetical protein PVJ52_01410 [Candidatus Woesebacteria bacterium]|jgi:adenylosuccinate lyase
MLTKTDLKQIDKVFSKRIKEEVKPIKIDIRSIKSDVSEARKDVKIIVNFFDKEYLEPRARVERIEEHLKLDPLTV